MSIGQVVTVTNTGSQSCALPDHVSNVHGTNADGTPNALSQLVQEDDRYYQTPESVPELTPGRRATFEFDEGAPGACEMSNSEATRVTSVTFSIGPDATFTADLTSGTVPMLLGCGGYGVTEFGAPDPNAKPDRKPKYDVESTRTVPSRIVGGQQMHYTITVTNKGRNTVPLSSCPTYTAFLAASPGDHSDQITGQLDCGGQTSIPAGGSIKFRLSIPVPSQLGVTAFKFGWWANGPSPIAEASTGAFIPVDR